MANVPSVKVFSISDYKWFPAGVKLVLEKFEDTLNHNDLSITRPLHYKSRQRIFVCSCRCDLRDEVATILQRTLIDLIEQEENREEETDTQYLEVILFDADGNEIEPDVVEDDWPEHSLLETEEEEKSRRLLHGPPPVRDVIFPVPGSDARFTIYPIICDKQLVRTTILDPSNLPADHRVHSVNGLFVVRPHSKDDSGKSNAPPLLNEDKKQQEEWTDWIDFAFKGRGSQNNFLEFPEPIYPRPGPVDMIDKADQIVAWAEAVEWPEGLDFEQVAAQVSLLDVEDSKADIPTTVLQPQPAPKRPRRPAGGRKKMPSQSFKPAQLTKGEQKLLAILDATVREVLTVTQIYDGTIEFKAVVGRILVRPFQASTASEFPQYSSDELIQSLPKSRRAYTEVVTTVASDLTSIINMVDRSKAPLWMDELDARHVEILLVCIDNVREMEFDVKITGPFYQAKAFMRRRQLGDIFVHVTDQPWDFVLKADGTQELEEELQQFARSLASSLCVQGNVTRPSLLFNIAFETDVDIQSVRIIRSSRRSGFDNVSRLSIVETEELCLQDREGPKGREYRAYPWDCNPEGNGPRRWFELHVSSPQIDRGLRAKATAGPTNADPWTVGKISAESLKSLCLAAFRVAQGLDGLDLRHVNDPPVECGTTSRRDVPTEAFDKGEKEKPPGYVFW